MGEQSLPLYSLAIPNAVKVTLVLEDLLASGHHGAEYCAWPIEITGGEPFPCGFVQVNPNSTIPARKDRGTRADTRF